MLLEKTGIYGDSGGKTGTSTCLWEAIRRTSLEVELYNNKDHYFTPMLCEKISGDITHVSAGLNHAVYVSNQQNVFCSGFNYYGQTGISNKIHELLEKYYEVEVPLLKEEFIQQVDSGTNHNVLMTTKGRVFFWGSVIANQYPDFRKNFGGGFSFTGPVEFLLPLESNEKVVKIKTRENRTVVWTNRDRVFMIGGLDQTFYCSYCCYADGLPKYDYYELSKDFKYKIIDVGIGLFHTCVITE